MTSKPFEYVHSEKAGSQAVLFVCDHASNALPEDYDGLGLSNDLLSSHIAFDIGAAEVTRSLAQAFAAPAVLARWSRLLIDLNRGEDDPTLVMQLSDGALVPGNVGVDANEIARRTAAYHEPYHRAIAEEIRRLRSGGITPALVSIHSFTPRWKSSMRPWEIGILWDRDDRLAAPLTHALRAQGFTVGDNEPYSGELENDCMYRHGTMNGLPHVLIEIRQDLVATKQAVSALVERIKPVLEKVLAGERSIRLTRPVAVKGVLMDETTRKDLEAAVFRRLVAHLRERTDVQNIDLMTIAGFCRNCLGDWYREAAAEKGAALGKDEAREIVYGMPPAEWKKRYQREATPEQQAAFERAQKTHK